MDLTSLVWLQIPKAVNTSNNHSFLPLTTTNFNLMSDFMKMATIYKKTTPFYKKNYFAPVKKKLQPQISVFKKNSIFGINRDPCHRIQEKVH